MTVRRFLWRDYKIISRVKSLAKCQPAAARNAAFTDSNTKENQGWFVRAIMYSLALGDELNPCVSLFSLKDRKMTNVQPIHSFFSNPPLTTDHDDPTIRQVTPVDAPAGSDTPRQREALPPRLVGGRHQLRSNSPPNLTKSA